MESLTLTRPAAQPDPLHATPARSAAKRPQFQHGPFERRDDPALAHHRAAPSALEQCAHWLSVLKQDDLGGERATRSAGQLIRVELLGFATAAAEWLASEATRHDGYHVLELIPRRIRPDDAAGHAIALSLALGRRGKREFRLLDPGLGSVSLPDRGALQRFCAEHLQERYGDLFGTARLWKFV